MSSYAYHDLNYPGTSFSFMNNMRDNNQLCDISLRVGRSVTKAHRVVLATASPYFYTMFTIDMTEKSQSEVELHDVDSDALRLLVEFSYTGRVIITEENVRNLFSTSSFLQIDSVCDACSTFMINHLRPSNCLGIRRLAETYSVDALSKQAYRYVLKNFEAVANSEEFLGLSHSEIENIVSEDRLNVLSEELVYLAVMRWIKEDQAERSQYVGQLFRFVRKTQISQEFLFDVVYKEPLVWNEPSCNKMWAETLSHQHFPERRSDLQNKDSERRLGGLGVYAIGGQCDYRIFSSGECYDFVDDCWLPIAPMSRSRTYAGVASLGGLIFAIGGHDGEFTLSSAECYDPFRNKWSSIKCMDSVRRKHGIGAMDGLLYVCGGSNSYSSQSIVDRYDPLTDVWLSCPNMNTPRKCCGVSVFNNCLYAIGGMNGFGYLSSAEMYDPRTSKWIAVPDMSVPRFNFSVATLNDTFYCVGGKKDQYTRLSCGERFNVRQNTWEPIAHMQHCRSSQGMVAVNRGLLVVGGVDGKSIVNTTEQYDPWNNQWTTVTPMQTPRFGLGTALLHRSDMDSKLRPAYENTEEP